MTLFHTPARWCAAAAVTLWALGASAETPSAPDTPPEAAAEVAGADGADAAPAVVEPAAMTTIEVAVTTIAADGATVGVADRDVTLHVVTPPHQLEATRRGQTGSDGIARFEIAVRPGAEAYAEIDDGGRRFSEPVDVSTPGTQRLSLSTLRTVRDPSVLFAASMQTILEPWEDYVVFSQVWTFGVDEMVRFSSSTDEMGSIVRVPLPEGAEGVVVVHPEDRARVMDGYVALGTDVMPAGMGEVQRPHLIVRFSLPTEGKPTLEYEQALSMDVSRMSIVIPQVSSHAKHPELDVRFDVPLCDDGAEDGVACFREISDRAEGTMLREGMEVLVARGEATDGQVVRVRTTGWPAAYPWGRTLAIVLSLLFVGAGGALYRYELQKRRATGGSAEAALAALRVQEEQLLLAAADLEEQLANGEVLQRDYDRVRGRLLEQLGVVYRRLRELGASPRNDADA